MALPRHKLLPTRTKPISLPVLEQLIVRHENLLLYYVYLVCPQAK